MTRRERIEDRRMGAWSRIAMALTFVVVGLGATGTPQTSAEATDSTPEAAGVGHPMSLTIRTLDPRTNLTLPGACYIVLGVAGELCDEAGTGNVHIADIPPGTYSVEQTRVPDGFLHSTPFTVTIAPQGPAYQWAYVSPDVDPTIPSGPVAIRTVDRLTGDVIPGVCLGLVGTDRSGCDDDDDGTIVLDAVPTGSYHVEIEDVPDGTHYRIAFTASAPIFIPADDRQEIELPLRDYDDAATDSQ